LRVVVWLCSVLPLVLLYASKGVVLVWFFKRKAAPPPAPSPMPLKVIVPRSDVTAARAGQLVQGVVSQAEATLLDSKGKLMKRLPAQMVSDRFRALSA
jgi:hypothetical protein